MGFLSFLFLLLLSLCCLHEFGIRTSTYVAADPPIGKKDAWRDQRHNSFSGFWYTGVRTPETDYDTLHPFPYANLTVMVNRSFYEGPGQSLVSDPTPKNNDSSGELYTGLTVNRQTFDTQFVLDMRNAIQIEVDRIYVLSVTPGKVHFSWEANYVIVNFIFLERNHSQGNITLLEAVATLTNQIQLPNAPLYDGNVTKHIVKEWGLEVVTWDMSVKLTYAIEVVGGPDVIDGYYLNQGGRGLCDSQTDAILYPTYCEFERFFEDDISRALNVSYYRVNILFIKKAAYDAVLVHFRIIPPRMELDEPDVAQASADLIQQIHDQNSLLYKGNVTIRIDPLWGLSETYPTYRTGEAQFSHKHYEQDESRLDPSKARSRRIQKYDRCKANRRCNWGVVDLNQTQNVPQFYHRLFDGGELYPIQLFLDFEDWRMGTRGFSFNDVTVPTINDASDINIRGAHFNPFNTTALGPDIPAYEQERNQGLVLDRQLLGAQIYNQDSLVDDLKGRIDWIGDNVEWAKMGPILRSRKDVKEHLTYVQNDYSKWWENEIDELNELTFSQCSTLDCRLTFNTSSLELVGAISGKGDLMTTQDGTEVAVFAFNSIYLGPEVQVTLCGQRALSLVSRTTAVINTTFRAIPGTLGGFPGGYSVGRSINDSRNDFPRDILICELDGYCDPLRYNLSEPLLNEAIISNNVNGPGSGNLRVHPFVIRTEAEVIREVHRIRSWAQPGQTIGGGFVIHFQNYSTKVLPHDISANDMKTALENNLNMNTLADGNNRPERKLGRVAGIGVVNVTRTRYNAQEGFEWIIIYTTAIGNIDLIRVTNYLTGLHSNITTETVVDGNELEGTFRLKFMDEYTEDILAYESAAGMKKKLLALPTVKTAFVHRIDPTENCDDGLCPNGPRVSRGMIWTLYITTDVDNITPFSPTSPLISQSGGNFELESCVDPNACGRGIDINAPVSNAQWRSTIDATNDTGPLYRSNATSTLLGANSSIIITRGTSLSPEDLMQFLNLSAPFSLAFGGGGGSYGGQGGLGYSENPVGRTYNDPRITDLIGGSGGCMRSQDVFGINAVLGPTTGRGGHGGGAIEVIAANDIEIGSHGKIIVNGGDGDQTSEGGGGGGSGGSISLAMGGVFKFEGLLDISGGRGAYGGTGRREYYEGNSADAVKPGTLEYRNLDSMSGGGGGGGRLAIFAESIDNRGIGQINSKGGACGIYKSMKNESVIFMNVSVSILNNIPINDDQAVTFLSATYINESMPTQFVTSTGISYNLNISAEYKYQYTVDFAVVVDQSTFAASDIFAHLTNASLTQKKTSMLLSELFMDYTITNYSYGYKSYMVEESRNCDNPGQDGTVHEEATTTSTFLVRPTNGGEDTPNALYLSNAEVTKTVSGSVREAPFAQNGPIMTFENSKPGRVTYYTRLDAIEGLSKKSHFGTLFSLVSRVSGSEKPIIGVYVGDKIMHGHNFNVKVDEEYFLKRFATVDEYPGFGFWYKVDLHIDWDAMTYYLLLNDVLVVDAVPFQAESMDGIRLSVNRAASVWFDEIYVGFDNTMGFRCPMTKRNKVQTSVPMQYGWGLSEEGGVYVSDENGELILGNSNFDMMRHYNHLDPTGSVPFNGEGREDLVQDLKFVFPDPTQPFQGDYKADYGKLHAGQMFYVTNSLRSAKKASGRSATVVSPDGLYFNAPDGDVKGGAGDGQQYMYTEYDPIKIDKDLPAALNGGGVGACSSSQLFNWRFEGIVFHYVNISDMVRDTQGPYKVERPRVLFNPRSQQYVLWSAVDNVNRELAMNLVATSPYEDGPFFMRRTMYPDGNRTRDQLIYEAGDNQTVLGRTYYATIEYVMPETVMQPSWESAKDRDGQVDFRLSYQRAVYDIGYDNYHDVYEQRWRKEDIEYKVECRNKLTLETRSVESGVINEEGAVCDQPQEEKIITGQGTPVILSRFVDPTDAENSWWVQSSVPGVAAQPWSSNYRDGYCGVRLLKENLDNLDPSLSDFSADDRGTCSNIADNPVHPALQDKLIGKQRVAYRRRSKFIALSALTPDYMDTSGFLNVYEGEFDAGNLVTMIAELGQYGFKVDETFKNTSRFRSTFPAPVRSEYETQLDYKYRFRQYMHNYNDRASYALACAIDGICPVNFRDQINIASGQDQTSSTESYA